MNKEQTTDMNSPSLSYLFIPSKDKLALVYNSPYKDGDQFGASLFLDTRGNTLNIGGVIFWKLSHLLNFQQSKQIDGNEVAVPYQVNQRKGFAIIRF